MEFGPTRIFTQIYAPGGKFPMRSCQPPKLHRKHPPTITAGHTRCDTFHIIPTKTVVCVCVCLAVSILSFLHFPVSGLGMVVDPAAVANAGLRWVLLMLQP